MPTTSRDHLNGDQTLGHLESFRNIALTRFLEEIDWQGFEWVVKRLSGNDTGLTGGHQVGVYFPRSFFESALPEICTINDYNPDIFIEECYFPAHDQRIDKLRAIYYNSKYFPEKGRKKKYDEFRMTRWGGGSSPVQDPENTGSVFVFGVKRFDDEICAVGWVANSLEEEHLIESWLGSEVEPACFYLSRHRDVEERGLDADLPYEWFQKFPSGRTIFDFVVQSLPRETWKSSIDTLLLARRKLEFSIFEKIEKAEVLPKVSKGFTSIEEFIKIAHSVSNRRKSRTGASLEFNIESILTDEGICYETQVITENRKKPDFLFPSGEAYRKAEFPSHRLNMLAAKTCCKDRWRQMLNEADRIRIKHLFTLQQGVSSFQLQEMKDSGVILVVPKPNLSSFPKEWRSSIMSLNQFVRFMKDQQSESGSQ